MLELYEQLLPIKLYHSQKTRTIPVNDVQSRLCSKVPESVPPVLTECSALTQNKYLARDKAASEFLFLEILQVLGLFEEVPPCYSPVEPKPTYGSRDTQAFWDIPVYAVQTEGRANRVDARIIDLKAKKVTKLEMSCPLIENRTRKDAEKTIKYGAMRWELNQQFKGYVVEPHNIIIDALEGWSNEREEVTQKLLGARRKYVLRIMQKSVISSNLNIAMMFKVMILHYY